MTELYIERANAGTDCAAVNVRETRATHLDRVAGNKTVVLQTDTRAGRTTDRKRGLALAVIEATTERFGVPESNQRVVFIEYEGSQVTDYDYVKDDWSESG